MSLNAITVNGEETALNYVQYQSDDSTADLNIGDNFGNVILSLENGDIKTKNFYSSNASYSAQDDDNTSDLNIGDNNGNVIVQFKNGHVKTKNFDSSQSSGGSSFQPYSQSNIRFQVLVNCVIADRTSNTVELQDSVEEYYDKCVLMLPETYTPNGQPTRLVIACHGAGGGTTDTDSQTEHQVQYKYLIANGFAVMDVNGIPQEYCTKYGVSYINNIGSPIAVQSYVKAYQWVITNYNIARDGVMVTGGSMGGISSSNLVMSRAIPVLAHAVSCPVLDTYNHIFLHPWSGGLPKTALGVIYGLEKDGSNNYIYNEDKICGYNPIVNGMESFNSSGQRVSSVGSWDFSTHQLNGQTVIEYKSYPCPLLIWHCVNDPTVDYSVSERQITAIRNAGGQAWLRSFPSGGHEPTLVGSYVNNPSGSLNYKGETLRILPQQEELYLFFKRYNVYKMN